LLDVAGPIRIGEVNNSGSFHAGDGVGLGYRQVGSGPPLLLVHGGGTDHRCFDPILDQLAERFTVTAYDRRGRGMSDNATDYSLDREAADVAELATFVGAGEPVGVLAYSYGATAALRAIAAGSVPVRALVAYEAPFDVPGMLPESERIVALVREQRYDDAMRLFVGSTFLLSDRVVAAMTRHPMWQVSLAAAPALVWELAGVLAARLEPPVGPVPPCGTSLPSRRAIRRSDTSPNWCGKPSPARTWPRCRGCRTSR
jgi:pimeloyl-ACP methyl ester carboxylesterase